MISPHPPLPARVLCVPFHRPFAGLVLAGEKTEETRGQAWRRDPQWIALYATAKLAQLQIDVPDRARRMEQYAEPESAQHVVGVVWVAGSRLLVREDFHRSLFWEAGRFAWHLERPRRLRRILSLAEAGLRSPPQSAVYIEGAVLEAAGFAS